jgi:NADPH-dependent stearoyl-CoA 9-desaturase
MSDAGSAAQNAALDVLKVAHGEPHIATGDDTLECFGRDIDRMRAALESSTGMRDLQRMRILEAVSLAFELAGRLLLQFGAGIPLWLAGVLSLWLRKQLQVEIGHTVLHGCFDRIDKSGRYNSRTFRWDAPVEESSWRRGHNLDHHGHTNVVGRDPDVRFGKVRLTEALPYSSEYRFGLFNDLIIWPWFFLSMTLHYTGLSDLYLRQNGDFQYIDDKSWQTIKRCHLLALRKLVPYGAINFVLFPALAGANFWKVLLGNLVAEVLRDLIMAAAIHCGHVGASGYPAGTKPTTRAHWYAMQVRASHNFRTSHWISVLVGGLNFQIEHHLFPRVPPNQLRRVAPEVERICTRHGIPYQTGPWLGVLRGAMNRIIALSRPPPPSPLTNEGAPT